MRKPSRSRVLSWPLMKKPGPAKIIRYLFEDNPDLVLKSAEIDYLIEEIDNVDRRELRPESEWRAWARDCLARFRESGVGAE